MRLITIPVSHFCEKARWALERLELPYSEERHPPVFHMVACLKAGGGRTAPVLIDRGRVYPDSTAILQHLDAQAPPSKRLYPSDPVAKAEVERLEDRYDEVLGPHLRRYAYAHLLGLKLTDAMLLEGVSPRARRMYGWSRGLLHGMMRKAMRIDAAGAERSLQRCWEIWEEAGERLSDGRPFLMGGVFTAADLSLAALGAAFVAPPEGYGGKLPSVDDLPAPLAEQSRRFQAHPTGQFILRLYREQRKPAR